MNTLRKINPNLVAKCGLYCGNCGKFKNGKCAGCEANAKASWCMARKCCIENGFTTCAECETNPRDCKKFSNFVSDIFSFIFRSDRPASIEYIKANGREAFIDLMIDQNRMVIKK
ncbi:MAG: DUF3795 domain-containing protein [Prolixibacteraceae bacterium]|nr:DUF3795 domain-containing protein [Prolixibacteraceae bacterium]